MLPVDLVCMFILVFVLGLCSCVFGGLLTRDPLNYLVFCLFVSFVVVALALLCCGVRFVSSGFCTYEISY